MVRETGYPQEAVLYGRSVKYNGKNGLSYR